MEESSPKKSEAASEDQDLADTASKLAIQCRALSERVATHTQRVKNSQELLGGEAATLQRGLDALTQRFEARCSKGELYEAHNTLQRAKQIFEGSGPGDDLRKLLPAGRNPLIIRLLLGRTTNVTAQDRSGSIKIKEEYYNFKDTNAVWFVVFSAVLLAAHKLSSRRLQVTGKLSLQPPIKVGVQLYLCWLMYFYVALSLRENVLKANGSKFRAWWIHHHYYSIGIVLIMLVLPVDSPAVNQHCERFLSWCVCQGVIMMMQNRYQRRRMYTRIALGKNSNMDIVAGESSGTSGQLLMLLPFLFGLQALQMYVGLTVIFETKHSILISEGWLEMEEHTSDLRGSRGACLCGALFVRMAVGNFLALVGTLVSKRQYRLAALSRSHSRQALNQNNGCSSSKSE